MTLHSASESDPRGVKLGYRPALDGIRAIAIACVLLAHTIGFAEGFVGVHLFFVLSGFLITTLLLEEHARNGRVSFRDFYRRRALRLFPALFVVLGVFLAFSVLAALFRGGSLDRAAFGVVAGLGYFSNFALAAETDPGTVMPLELRHLWSLAIEEQFYVLWPPVLFLVLRGRRRLALVVLAAVVILSVFQQTRLYLDGATARRIAYGTDTGSVSILVGCALAIGLATIARSRLEANAVKVAPLAIAGFLALLFVNPHGSSLFSAWVLALALCCACLILRALDSRSALARTLSLGPFVFLGRISYSLYLWHLPIYVMLDVGPLAELMDVPALVLALACAVASYYFIEMPFLRRKNRPAQQPTEAQPLAVPA